MKFAYMPDTHFGEYNQAPPSPQEAGAALDLLIEEAILAEEVGFDAVFLPERHMRGETFAPSPLTLAAAIAARTKRIRIATTVMMPVLYNPMHLAEQISLIDNLSKGRFIFGAGVGYHSDYHRMFGVPWPRRGKRFEEAMQVISTALAGERFSFHGEFYHYDDVFLTPRPYQRPRPPIWIGTHTAGKPLERALDFDGWVLWTQPDWATCGPWVKATRERAAARGKPHWTVVLDQDGWIGDDPAAMRARHAPRWLREARFYRDHHFPAKIDPQGDIREAERADAAIRELEARQWHFGTPATWIQRIHAIRERIAPDWLNIRLRTPRAGYGPSFPEHREFLEAVRRFGEEVLPACR